MTPATASPLDGLCITLGALSYRVELVTNLHADDGARLWGDISFGKGLIRIERNATSMQQAITLWHELFHALVEQSGREHDEGLITMLGYGMGQLLRDNPALVETAALLHKPMG